MFYLRTAKSSYKFIYLDSFINNFNQHSSAITHIDQAIDFSYVYISAILQWDMNPRSYFRLGCSNLAFCYIANFQHLGLAVPPCKLIHVHGLQVIRYEISNKLAWGSRAIGRNTLVYFWFYFGLFRDVTPRERGVKWGIFSAIPQPFLHIVT